MFRTLNQPPKSFRSWLAVLLITLIITYITVYIANTILISQNSGHYPDGMNSEIIGMPTIPFNFLTIPLFALKEELYFRASIIVGLSLINHRLYKKNPTDYEPTINQNVWILVLLFIPFSIYFGYWHGNWANIFTQGTLGFCLAMLFLKTRRGNNFLPGLLTATLAHSLWNYVYLLTR